MEKNMNEDNYSTLLVSTGAYKIEMYSEATLNVSDGSVYHLLHITKFDGDQFVKARSLYVSSFLFTDPVFRKLLNDTYFITTKLFNLRDYTKLLNLETEYKLIQGGE